jgi:hypothetical protein
MGDSANRCLLVVTAINAFAAVAMAARVRDEAFTVRRLHR